MDYVPVIEGQAGGEKPVGALLESVVDGQCAETGRSDERQKGQSASKADITPTLH